MTSRIRSALVTGRGGLQRPKSGSGGRSLPPVAYFATAGAIVLIAVLVAVAVTIFTHDEGQIRRDAGLPPVTGVRAEGPGASAYSQAASTEAFAAIADRHKDPKPLTAAEVFRTKKITDSDAKASLRLTASKLDSHCTAAIWGTHLAGLLEQGRCTQAARAMYADRHFDALVTIFNLSGSAAADRVVAQADPKSGNGFPLVPSRSAPFNQGFSIARGVAMGHFAVLTWVRHTNGTGDERDTALLSLLVTTGRPAAVLIRATDQGRNG